MEKAELACKSAYKSRKEKLKVRRGKRKLKIALDEELEEVRKTLRVLKGEDVER
jgi:hypothetical protein